MLKKAKIKDLGTIITGKTPSTKIDLFWNGEIDFITPKDIQVTKHIFKTERSLSYDGMNAVASSLLPANAICVSCIGNIGYVGMTTKRSVTNQQINSIICNQDNDPNFVFYLMKSLWSRFKKFEGQSTTISILNKGQFSDIDISLPSLQEQKKIAAQLSCIDEKIELNAKINDNLYAVLEAVYQEKFTKPKSESKIGILSDICFYANDKIDVSKLDTRSYFSTENMLPEKKGASNATQLPTVSKVTACSRGDTLISNIRPYFKKIVYSEIKCGCSNDVLCFSPKSQKYSSYLFSTLFDDAFFAFMTAGSKGTKMPRGDKVQIMTYPVKLPADNEVEAFNTVAIPILKQIHSNNMENRELASLKDSLLKTLFSDATK